MAGKTKNWSRMRQYEEGEVQGSDGIVFVWGEDEHDGEDYRRYVSVEELPEKKKKEGKNYAVYVYEGSRPSPHRRHDGFLGHAATKDEARSTAVDWMKNKGQGQVYRVWSGYSNAATGDRREIARYRAYSLDQVIAEVRKNLLNQDVDEVDESGHATYHVFEHYHIPDREETELSKEEYEDAKEYGEIGENQYIEIKRVERDHTELPASGHGTDVPMKLVTGEAMGEDLTQ